MPTKEDVKKLNTATSQSKLSEGLEELMALCFYAGMANARPYSFKDYDTTEEWILDSTKKYKYQFKSFASKIRGL